MVREAAARLALMMAISSSEKPTEEREADQVGGRPVNLLGLVWLG